MTPYYDFEQFKVAAEYWIERLGLTDWAIDVVFEPLGDDDGDIRARCRTNWTQRSARLILNSAYQPPRGQNLVISDWNPERTALHEVLHLLLCDLINVVADQRDAYCNTADGAEHAVLRRLMRILPPPPVEPAQPTGE